MHSTRRLATANGGLRFSPDAALRLGCPRSLVETGKQLGLPCTAPPPRAPGGIWSVDITCPEDEDRLHEDTSRRRRELGLPPLGDVLGGRTIAELDAQDEAVADRELADFDPDMRAEIIARWRAARRSLARSHAAEARVYRESPPPVHHPRPTPLVRVPRLREARPRARRTAARRASGLRAGQDPGDGDGESEPASALDPSAGRRRTMEAGS